MLREIYKLTNNFREDNHIFWEVSTLLDQSFEVINEEIIVEN